MAQMSDLELLLSILSLIEGGLQLGGSKMLGENGQVISGWICVIVGAILLVHYLFYKFLKQFINKEEGKFQKFRGFLKRKLEWLKKYSENPPDEFTYSEEETHWQLNLLKGIETALGKNVSNEIQALFSDWSLNNKDKKEEVNKKIQYLKSRIFIHWCATDLLPTFDPMDLEQFESNEDLN